MSRQALDFPAEIHELVLSNLDLPKPLFRPSYGQAYEAAGSGEGDLLHKHRQYWGPERTEKQHEAVLAVVNLSRTSQYYADLTAPTIYHTLVLRPTVASLAFARGVQQSESAWKLVKHLIVCTEYRKIDFDMLDRFPDDPDVLRKYTRHAEIDSGLILAHQLDRPTSPTTNATQEHAGASDGNSRPFTRAYKARLEQPHDVKDQKSEFEYDYDPTENLDLDTFAAVLEDLPPNLEKLTIDTPTDWFECFEAGDYLDFFVHEIATQVLEAEQAYIYRKQIHTIYKAICSQKNLDLLTARLASQEFQLEILNFPPLSCSVFPGAGETPYAKADPEAAEDKESAEQLSEAKQQGKRLSALLNLVTDFKLSCCHWDNGAGWHMNTHASIPSLSASLPTFLFNHLSDRCRRFVFEGDKSWILGDYRSQCTSMNPLPLDKEGFTVSSAYEERHIRIPGLDSKACSQVQDVEIINTIAGREILDFLKIRAPTIKTLKLQNCWVHALEASFGDASQCRSWASFLEALSDTIGTSVVKIEISYDSEETAQINNDQSQYRPGFDIDAPRPSFRVSTGMVGGGDANNGENGVAQDEQKFKFGYGSISDKYGDLFANEEVIAESTKTGKDWNAWLKLVQIVQQNAGRGLASE